MKENLSNMVLSLFVKTQDESFVTQNTAQTRKGMVINMKKLTKKTTLISLSVIIALCLSIGSVIFVAAGNTDQSLSFVAEISGWNNHGNGNKMAWGKAQDELSLDSERQIFYQFNITGLDNVLTNGKAVKKIELILKTTEYNGNVICSINKLSSPINTNMEHILDMPAPLNENGVDITYTRKTLRESGIDKVGDIGKIEISDTSIISGDGTLPIRLSTHTGSQYVNKFASVNTAYKPVLKVTYGKPDIADPVPREFESVLVGYNDDANIVYNNGASDAVIRPSANPIGTTDGVRAAYLKFDLRPVGGKIIKSAKLKLQVGSRGMRDYSVDIKMLENANFTTSTNKFNLMPAITNELLMQGDLVKYMKGSTTNSIGEVNLNKNKLTADMIAFAILPSDNAPPLGASSIYTHMAPDGMVKPTLLLTYEDDPADPLLTEFLAIEDTFAGESSSPDTDAEPQGHHPVMMVRYYNEMLRDLRAFIKFDLTNIDYNRVKSVKLQLQHAPATPGINFTLNYSPSLSPAWEIYTVGSDWSDATLCGNNMDKYLDENDHLFTSLDKDQLFQSNRDIIQIELDKNYINKGMFSLQIRDVSPTNEMTSFYSKEGDLAGIGFGPRLFIEYYSEGQALTNEFKPIEDTFGCDMGTTASQTQSHGSRNVLFIRKNEAAPRHATTFIKYDLRKLVKKDLQSLKLKIKNLEQRPEVDQYSTNYATAKFGNLRISLIERNWHEGTLTFANMPERDGEIIGTASGGSYFTAGNQIIEINLDIAKIESDFITIAIDDIASVDNQISIWSKEGESNFAEALAPTIVANYSVRPIGIIQSVINTPTIVRTHDLGNIPNGAYIEAKLTKPSRGNGLYQKYNIKISGANGKVYAEYSSYNMIDYVRIHTNSDLNAPEESYTITISGDSANYSYSQASYILDVMYHLVEVTS